jgi:hypothetical protein
MRSILAIFLVGTIVFGACSSNDSSNTPTTPSTLNLAGTWAGSVTFQGVTAQMTWMLTETGTSVSGPALVALSTGTVLLNGALTGTISGSTLTYAISVGAGGIPSRPTCTGQLTGTMNVTIGSPSSMTGAPSITSNTCAPPLSSENVTLTR